METVVCPIADIIVDSKFVSIDVENVTAEVELGVDIIATVLVKVDGVLDVPSAFGD